MKYFLGLFASGLFLVVSLRAIRVGVMRLRYAILWVTLGLGVFVIALKPSILSWTANLFGIILPINMLFFFSIVVMGFIIFMVSFENSVLQMRVVELASNLALLEQRIDSLQKSRDDNAG